MARAKTTGFSLPEDMQADLEAVVQEFAGGNRSEFLRIAVREYKGRMLATRLSTIRAEARAEMGGATYTPEQVRSIVVEALAGKHPAA
jgi:Arc/MetJ-type ribon-helix-helix transcriptional regulator